MLTATLDLSVWDTLHITLLLTPTGDSRAKVTVTQILSGAVVTKTHKNLNKNFSHTNTDTDKGTKVVRSLSRV